jgi:hypothetical protein
MGPFAGYLHPALLWGLALAAVPLVIHLLNRRRHRPLEWGAMRFVQAAYRRTRRRVQLENWLLLLLRMAAIAALALCVARPFLGSESPLATLTEQRRDVVLVLDGSASTGYRDVKSVHEGLLERARALLSQLDGTRGDRARLYFAGRSLLRLATHAPEDALAALSTLDGPLDEPLALDALLAELLQLAREDAGTSGHCALEVRLLTDLQRNTFTRGDAAGPRSEASPDPTTIALDELTALGVRILVEDLGPSLPTPANLAVEEIEPVTPVLGAGLATEVAVRLRNFGPSGRYGVRVALSVNGERLPTQELDVEGRASAQAVFLVSIEQPGFHALEAEIEGDRLALDDRRAEVVHVPAPLRVLLVNGAPSEDVGRDEVGVLRAALEPPDDQVLARALGATYAPFVCSEVPAAGLETLEQPFESFDVIVLANVPSVPSQAIEGLERWVAGGGCLVVTLGDRSADPSAMQTLNARLGRADETGLMPAKLLRIEQGDPVSGRYFRTATFAEEHPALAFFADERWRPYLTELPIQAFVACTPSASARVLARLDDEAQSALLVERPYERGRVFLWTTSIDADWNAFPRSPATLIPLFHELLRYGGTGLIAPRSVPVGASLALELTSFPRGATLVRPDQTRTPLAQEPRVVAEGRFELGPLGPLERAGLWRVESEGAVPQWIASQLETAESDLARLGAEELERLHPAWRLYRPGDESNVQGDDPAHRGELWRWLAALTLALLVAETLWAAWIGRGRRIAP